MNRQKINRPSPQALGDAVSAYQADVVIPHCPACSRSCCRLDPLVLELNWKQLRTIWMIEEPRAVFDRRLRAGEGPADIREGNGLYYAHGKACPAFDENGQRCRVYGQPVKPVGCSDFPVYEDGDVIVADLRCEAVRLEDLQAAVAKSVGPAFRVHSSADRDFPFMVTLSVRRAGGR
jgi:Fe-S-cluster containining protein